MATQDLVILSSSTHTNAIQAIAVTCTGAHFFHQTPYHWTWATAGLRPAIRHQLCVVQLCVRAGDRYRTVGRAKPLGSQDRVLRLNPTTQLTANHLPHVYTRVRSASFTKPNRYLSPLFTVKCVRFTPNLLQHVHTHHAAQEQPARHRAGAGGVAWMFGPRLRMHQTRCKRPAQPNGHESRYSSAEPAADASHPQRQRASGGAPAQSNARGTFL